MTQAMHRPASGHTTVPCSALFRTATRQVIGRQPGLPPVLTQTDLDSTSYCITVSVTHLQIKQDLADGHPADLFRCPAELFREDETGARKWRLDEFF